MKTFITGIHRNADLAERHRRAIERENPGSTVTIANRMNQAGEVSDRGQTFQFVIETKSVKKQANSLQDFWDAFDDAVEFEFDEYGSRPEYGEE